MCCRSFRADRLRRYGRRPVTLQRNAASNSIRPNANKMKPTRRPNRLPIRSKPALNARQEARSCLGNGSFRKSGRPISRRRLQIDERLDQLSRHQTDLEEQSRSLVEHQLLPVGVLAGLGVAFVLGVVLILAGLFMPASITGSIGWALASFGFGRQRCGGIGKISLGKITAPRSWIPAKNNLAMLQSQVEQTKSEREQLDAQLPRGGGPIVSRLEAAEKDLASLEELVPLGNTAKLRPPAGDGGRRPRVRGKSRVQIGTASLARGPKGFGIAGQSFHQASKAIIRTMATSGRIATSRMNERRRSSNAGGRNGRC